MTPFLSLDRIRKRFGGVVALDDVSLDLKAGEVHCLAGENGSGKSTLIKVIAGTHQPDAGTLALQGTVRPGFTPVESIRAGIQVIYQDLSVFPNLTVAENLAVNDLLEHGKAWVNWKRVRRVARQALDQLGIDLDLDRALGELPTAQRQLVAIARALLHDARLIILDEPTTALTRTETDALFEIIRGLTARGVAILFVSHHLREMRAISDRFTVLRNGRVTVSGPAADFDERAITEHMTGRQLSHARWQRPTDAAEECLLQLENLSGPVLRGVDLQVFAGEIVGVTGLLGSGQEELPLLVMGLASPTGGSIRVSGKSTHIGSIRDAIGLGLAYVPEDRLTEGLFLDQPIAENVVASSLETLRGPGGLIAPARIRQEAESWLKQLRIKAGSSRDAARTLSGGNQQRVVLAKWLSTHPRVLILNGPTAGVDIGSKEDIHRKLRELAGNGLGVLMISTDLPELAQNCNRVLVMRHGRIATELSAADCDEATLAAEVHEAH